ncbi:sulfatase-like hydrolase/transferase [Planctomycetes bacterium K23_9]|uniref:Arylsulfatase n=1 Tax=Stieleria marina TaxID=1930275 RepID=A0A517NLX5_9BACT|nr:Arylsulfatase [Planctomycetes bacterium K23_9]
MYCNSLLQQIVRDGFHFVFLIAACLATSTWSTVIAQSPEQRPIIAIVVDDLFAYDHYRNTFGVELLTPHLDRLSSRGATFANAYAPIPVCNGSRAATMTGLSPFRTKLHMASPTQWNELVPIEQNWVSAMGAAGYHTAGVGKVFHNSANAVYRDIFESIYDQFRFEPGVLVKTDPGRIANALAAGKSIKDQRYTNWAVQKIQNHRADQRPLLLTVGLVRPHRPFVVPQEYFDLYPQSEIVLPQDTEGDLADVSEFYKSFRLQDGYHSHLVNNGWTKEFVQGYLASITFADAQIGRILDAIDGNLALADATIVFWSDNGFELGHKRTYNKFTLWEASSNVPLIVVDPSATPGSVNETPVSLLDIFPTMLELAGETIPSALDGHSLLDVIENPGNHDDDAVIMTMIGSIAIRWKELRLIKYNDGTIELYNSVRDRLSRRNISTLGVHSLTTIPNLLERMKQVVAQQGGVFDGQSAVVNGTSGDDALMVNGLQDVYGGDGDDLYFLADGGNAIEAVGGGYDRVVFADFDFTIPDHVEYVRNHTYANGRTFRVHGNDFGNEIYIASAKADVSAAGGDDVIDLGFGFHLADAGAGNDLIVCQGRADLFAGGSEGDAIICGIQSDTVWGDKAIEPDPPGAALQTEGDLIIADGVSPIDLLNADMKYRLGNLTNEAGYSLSTEALRKAVDVLPKRYQAFTVDASRGAADLIHAGLGNDLVFAQGGDDDVHAGKGDDRVHGGDGNDRVHGEEGADLLYGGEGNDWLSGNVGDDRLYGEAGHDSLLGGSGNDRMFADDGNDVIHGQSGDDVLLGGHGNDRLLGGVGNDQLVGHPGSDDLMGNAGNDQLSGGTGDDDMDGGEGDDQLAGGPGRDYLKGGPGNDSLSGGVGPDCFVIMSSFGNDMIDDFSAVDELVVTSPAYTSSAQIMNVAVQDGDDVLIGTAGYSVRVLNTTLAVVSSRITIQ